MPNSFSEGPALSCPRCHSAYITERDYARTTGGVIGAVAGAWRAVAAELAGAKTSVAAGTFNSPRVMLLSGLASALMGALLGAAAGSASGAAVGEIIDETVLDNFECKDCGHTFGHKKLSPS
ncbi:hypothetical protein [Bordetella hinzii]|uniref:hypothetical protein n=1 Tax=Bordetella hinzii TaxID=103855 RepID=UPI0039FCBA6D